MDLEAYVAISRNLALSKDDVDCHLVEASSWFKEANILAQAQELPGIHAEAIQRAS